jgi:hypothetical protein
VKNHRGARLGPLQLFEQTGCVNVIGAIGQRKADQHDIEILTEKKLDSFRRAAHRNAGRQKNFVQKFRRLFSDAKNSWKQASFLIGNTQPGVCGNIRNEACGLGSQRKSPSLLLIKNPRKTERGAKQFSAPGGTRRTLCASNKHAQNGARRKTLLNPWWYAPHPLRF